MKKLIAGSVATLLSIGLFAGDCCCCEDSIVSLGGSYTRSHIDPDGLSDLDGNMGGVQGMYQYRPLCNVYAAIGGYWRAGKNTGSAGTRDLTDAGVHQRIGYTFSLCDCFILLSPYTGFGYRHLSHHVKPQIGSKIKLRYNEFYIPVGLQTVYDTCQWLSIGLDAVWMPQVYPTVTFDVTDGARWVTECTLKNFNVALPFYFDCFCNLNVVLKPFFEFWENGKTIAKTQFNDPLGLPKTSYTFWGLELNLQYTF
ncbi:MAG: hypothetical protein P0S96_05565 [Simkaniaceae bacterium]|nr:hypothetical protein [Candidatus Sacchlamyda saccharinae]